MEKPKLSANNRIKAQQRRACDFVTDGINTKINVLHEIKPSKRLIEYLIFALLYFFGAFLMHQFFGNLIIWLVSILLMGIAFNMLPILLHDGLHGLLAKNEKLNHFISFLTGLPLLVSTTAYQTTHTHHHYELGRKLDYGTYKQYFKAPVFVWTAYFLQLTLGATLYTLFIPFLGFKDASPRSRVFIILEYLLIATLATALVLHLPWHIVLNYWLYPTIVMSILTNLRGLASHALGDVEDIYVSSRTVKCSKIMSLIFMNENYHLEHHLFPTVPSYNLDKVHNLVWKKLPRALHSHSYLHFLKQFFSAAFKNDLSPQGVIHPNQETKTTS